MIIGIDGNEANVRQRVGIGEYAFELLSQFSNLKLKTSNLNFVIYLKNDPLSDMPKEREGWRYKVIKPGKLWTQWRLPLDLYLGKIRPDVFFSPSHYAPRFSPVPTVISVMDLAYLNFPEMFNKSDLFQLRRWTSYSVKNAKKILTISNSSKNDIIKSYNAAPDKITVTYPGVKQFMSLSPQIYAMNQLKSKYKTSENYILFVGTLQPRKNIERLIEAFSLLLKNPSLSADDGRSLQLVIVGKKGWLYEEILAAPKKFDIEDRVKFLDTVADEELEVLYRHAVCFVLPSLYEGFGLPVLEAMHNNCPVVTSNISSLPEAGGDACLYIDPEDATDIANKLVQLTNDDDLRQELIKKGKKQLAHFSWEKTAKETLKVLENAGGMK